MKSITRFLIARCCWVLVAASTCFAQMYTVTDLGTLGGTHSGADGINASGQVVGFSDAPVPGGYYAPHAFRTAPNSPINPATDDLSGGLPGFSALAFATGVNASGQAIGFFDDTCCTSHGFRTTANSPINLDTDDLGGGPDSVAYGINDSGQVVGYYGGYDYDAHAFRTAPNSPINPATDDLGGGPNSNASGINASGQVVGRFMASGICCHAFRTAPNRPINPATDDLGTLGGPYSGAYGINDSGQVVGYGVLPDGTSLHAFRTAPNRPINPATDDLGTLGGSFSWATSINASGQVVGYGHIDTGGSILHAFLYNGVMHDLNDLIPSGSGWVLDLASGINDAGQISGTGEQSGETHAFLLTPVYKAFVQPPINANGSSVFKAGRGAIPVKFTLTQYDAPTCALPPATIEVTRTAGGKLGSVRKGSFSTTGCRYHYNLGTSSLGGGTYRVDISINGIFVGHAVFALKCHPSP
jgi:probable HAF family extracellular repeat protein